MSHSRDDGEMECRLRRLERTNRRLVASTTGLALALGAIVSCGLMNSTSGIPDDLEVTSVAARTITLTDSLVVVGVDGQTVIKIARSGMTVGTPTSGHTHITGGLLTSRAGNAGQVRAHLSPTGLILTDESGIPRMALSSGNPLTTASSLQFYDELGRYRMTLWCQASYGGRIAFTDASGDITNVIGKPGVALGKIQSTDATADLADVVRSIHSSERGLSDAVRRQHD